MDEQVSPPVGVAAEEFADPLLVVLMMILSLI
jgi:hypothetical protein